MTDYLGNIRTGAVFGSIYWYSSFSRRIAEDKLVHPIGDIVSDNAAEPDSSIAVDITERHYRPVYGRVFEPVTRRTYSFAPDIVRNEIYYSLKEITGFFTEDQAYELTIWNAKYTPVVISNINVDSVEGTDLEPFIYPSGVPEDGFVKYNIAIFADGPATQNTTYTFTIDSQEFSTVITGTRVLAFALPVNWDKPYKFSLSFETVVEANKKGREQRRPLRTVPLKSTDLSILIDNVEKSDIFQHWLDFAKERFIALPIYQEAMFMATDLLEGVMNITVDTDTSNFSYLSETRFVLLMNYETYSVEIKEIDEVDIETGYMLFKNPVISGVSRSNLVIYPTYFSSIRLAQYSTKTDSAADVKLKFKEAFE